jgi:hypothetical protein
MVCQTKTTEQGSLLGKGFELTAGQNHILHPVREALKATRENSEVAPDKRLKELTLGHCLPCHHGHRKISGRYTSVHWFDSTA